MPNHIAVAHKNIVHAFHNSVLDRHYPIDTIEPNDNGVIKTGVAVSVVSISFIIAIISLAVLFVLRNSKIKYNH